MLKYAHHVHYYVYNLDDMIDYLEKNFGMKPDSVEEHHDALGAVKEAFYQVDKTLINVIEPLDPDSSRGRHLRENGPGITHVAWGVDDIEQAAKKLAENGNKFTGQQPVTQSTRGYKELNVDRESSFGLLFQLCEGPKS